MWRRLARRRRSRGRRSCWGRTGPAAPTSPARRRKGRTCGERPGPGGRAFRAVAAGPAGWAAAAGRPASVTAGPPALRGRLGSPAAGGSRGLRPGRGRAGTPLRRGRAVGRLRSGPADGSGERGAGSGERAVPGRREARSRGEAASLGGDGVVRGRSGSSRAGTVGMGAGRLQRLFSGTPLENSSKGRNRCE